MGAVITAYRNHPFHGSPVSQSRVAMWARCAQPHVSRIENGRAIDSIAKLEFWSSLLKIPQQYQWFTSIKSEFPATVASLSKSEMRVPSTEIVQAVKNGDAQPEQDMSAIFGQVEADCLDRQPGGLSQECLKAHILGNGLTYTSKVEKENHLAAASASNPASFSVDFDSNIDLGTSPAEYIESLIIDNPLPNSIGWSDVVNMRSITRMLALSENMHGGGFSYEAAAAQLRRASRLTEARASNQVRKEMLEAIGNLGGVVAFSAFDVADYNSAKKCFNFALWCAQESGSWALRANTLSDMARNSAYLGNLDGALSQIEFAQVRSDRVSETARAMMCTIRARLLAAQGKEREAISEVNRADEYFANRNINDDPPWLCYYDEAEHQGSTGRALISVAVSRKDADLAAPRLRNAISLHDETYPRSKIFSQTRLASLLLQTGDPIEAVQIGRTALTESAKLQSRRVTEELRQLGRSANMHKAIPAVVDLQNDLFGPQRQLGA
ncbi:hypothetical protein [Umezawaea sp. Da 62-37]|uniref:hypothetical protein n=1 Tax=Umezawaea sp. Da 62-37 TaxID=3075927 RepID=UPI0028F6C9EC|nr:hypothetical protein [Umezawaea sp. Da 62-37]WNV89692.1 hypothetical protein RM788_15725 [Umezawaea sp. Da 62-37]